MSYMDIRKYGRNPNKGKELSYRFIAHLIGLLLAFESILLLACCCVSMAYNESDLMSFIVSFSICLSASVILSVFGRKKESIPSRYEAYIVVALSWFFLRFSECFPICWAATSRLSPMLSLRPCRVSPQQEPKYYLITSW